MDEDTFIAALRTVTRHPAARGLLDDVAVMGDLVFSHDTIVEGIHYLPTDPADSVAWKLLGVTLSDLASKGAAPVAALMAYSLTSDDAWDLAFVEGLDSASRHFDVPVIGGDTVRLPPGNARVLGLTVIGRSTGAVPSRSGAGVGDALFVTGTIGDAGLGLKMARGMAGGTAAGDPALLMAYQRPVPQIAAGHVLSGVATAMMDVSDGLLIDAKRIAAASGVGVRIDLDAIPLSLAYVAVLGENRAARLAAATAGDDYQLLFTCPHPLPPLPVRVTRIGHVVRGEGVSLFDGAGVVPVPDVLGWQH